MARTRLIGIVGRKNAGKTTLLVALAAYYTRRGMRVATLKHGHHPASADREGKDTWRHYHEGNASQVLIESPGQRVLFERTPDESDPFSLCRTYLAGADVILIEGFKRFALPKIEVHRREIGRPLLEADDVPGPWIALVTDDGAVKAPCATFRFNDTSWLQSLTTIALDRALALDEAP